LGLSIRRAEAVYNYLVSKGLAAERMSTMGYGETRPISSNNTANGRALNRRTEIQLR
jgi:outer membrane protein OmpA-like peptidoglycan-associated protein